MLLGRKENALLAVLPAIVFVLGTARYAITAPIYAGLGGYDYDPAYVYLLSGLSLLNGVAPQHIDHPGTPMQMLCAVLIVAYWALSAAVTWKPAAIAELVLSQPEAVLTFISHTLLSMNVVATYVLGRTIYRCTGNWMAAALSQLSLPLLSISFFHIMYLNAEALAIFATLLLLAVLAREALCGPVQDRLGTAAPVAAGALVALAVTAKVTFLPLAVLLFSLRPWRKVWTGFLACIVAGSILLAPVLPQMHRFVAWIGSIGTHSGQYGTGEASVVAWGQLPGRIYALAAAFPVSTTALIALCIVGCLAIPHIPGSWRADAAGDNRNAVFRLMQLIGLACLVQIAMVLKHFAFHYAISTVLLAAVAVVLLGLVLFTGRRTAYFLPVLVAAAVAATSHLYTDFAALRRASQERTADLARIAAAIERQDRPLLIASYRVRDSGYALRFALSYLDNGLVQGLLGTDHEHWSHNRWNGKLLLAGGTWREVDDLEPMVRQGRNVLLLLPADVSIPGLRTETLVEIGKRERLLKVVGFQDD
jgi:hypothetical protein